MAGNGPPPKENHRHRNADVYADVKQVVSDDGEICGPALEGDWSMFVRAWWDNWRRSPQAKTFVITDWMRLRMVAPLVDSYMESPTATKLAEIRQNESLLGATVVDRLKGRIKVEKPDAPAAPLASVKVMDEYRNALGA